MSRRSDTPMSWDGAPFDLVQFQTATMPQTPNGAMVFGYVNMAPKSNDGQLTLVSGGGEPLILDAPAGANAPSILVHNWRANSLSVTNTSEAAETPIQIEGFGPGIPGVQSMALAINVPLALGTYDTAIGPTKPAHMRLKMRAGTGLAVIAVIGGPADPSGSNARVFALNFAGSAPPFYSEVTSDNALVFPFHWNGSAVFVANMSPSTADPVQITLQAL